MFERSTTGLTLTVIGEDLLSTATELEILINRFERRVRGHDAKLHGILRLTAPDFLIKVFGDDIESFTRNHPAIELHILADTEHLNLSNREADVAIRVTSTPPPQLIGRKLSNVAAGIYRSTHLEWRANPADYPWLSWIKEPPATQFSQWMEREVSGARIACRVNTPAIMLDTIEAGVGVGLLACAIGDQAPTLTRALADPIHELGSELWLLTHSDLRTTGRVRAFLDFLIDAVGAHRGLLEGLG